MRYNDGFLNYPPEAPDSITSIGYPEDYLNQIGYDDAFVFAHNINRAKNEVLSVLKELENYKERNFFEPGRNGAVDIPIVRYKDSNILYGALFLLFLGACITHFVSTAKGVSPPYSRLR